MHDLQRTRRYLMAALCVLMPMVVALAGCSGPDVEAERTARNGAFNDLTRTIEAYLALPQDLFQRDPEKFFAEGDKRMRRIRDAQVEWLEAARTDDLPVAASNGTPSEATVRDFNAALDAWIEAQEEQGRLSKTCWMSLERETCYRDMISTHGDRWNATADRLNKARAKMTKEANR